MGLSTPIVEAIAKEHTFGGQRAVRLSLSQLRACRFPATRGFFQG